MDPKVLGTNSPLTPHKIAISSIYSHKKLLFGISLPPERDFVSSVIVASQIPVILYFILFYSCLFYFIMFMYFILVYFIHVYFIMFIFMFILVYFIHVCFVLFYFF